MYVTGGPIMRMESTQQSQLQKRGQWIAMTLGGTVGVGLVLVLRCPVIKT
jgi:hypothetical protein